MEEPLILYLSPETNAES